MPDGPARYRAVLDNLDQVVFETDRDGRWTYLNAAWTKITGWRVEESLGSLFLDQVHPGERQRTLELFQQFVRGPEDHCAHETRYLTADGSYRWIELRASMLFDEDGSYIGIVGTILDITDRRRAEDMLDEQNRLLADHNTLLEMVARGEPLEKVLGAVVQSLATWTGHEAVVATDLLRGPREDAGKHGIALRAMPGRQAPKPVPLADTVPVSDEDLDLPVHSIGEGVRLGRFVLRHARSATLSDTDQLVLDRSVHLAAIAIGREQVDAAARHEALHDPLTGLPNRTLVTDRLQQALGISGRHHYPVALLLLDLDHFKVINDTFGHGMGDRVLKHVAERLQEGLRDSDTVGRLGGDEFAIVLPSLVRSTDADSVAASIRDVLQAPLRLGGVDFHLEGSIGIAVSSGPQDEPADLLRFADVAMYRAKREGTGHARYDPDLDAERLRGFNLIGQLRHAIRRNQLVLHYQPKIALESGRVVGMESLVRWQHPVRGLVGPNEFIPLAEMTGAVQPLLRWVLRQALEDSHTWRAQGFDGSIAVNVSAQSLHDQDLPRLVGDLLAQQEGWDGMGRLEFEITENAIMVDPEGAIAAMARLQDLGVMFSIDDFGTGYSSLTYLKNLPAHAIKIDKSFVRNMEHDERDALIVRTAVALAHDLHIEVTAEGVETEAVSTLLQTLGCDSAQGFYFAHPMPTDVAGEWLHHSLSGRR